MARLLGNLRWGRLAVALAILPVLVVPSALALNRRSNDPPPPPRVAQAAEPETAFVAARQQNEPVQVASLTTPTRGVSAKPDGSLVAELTTRPVRMLRGATWVPIDQKLVARPDGTVGPRTVATELTFGGKANNNQLVRFGAPGKSFTLSWPGKLPAPELKGTDATYRDVLPGVDLVLKAEPDGFAQHLVVKNAAAAKNPALAKIRLGLTTDGLKLSTAANGAIAAKDAAGKVVFTAPPSAMWDDAGKRARVGVAVDAKSLTLTPDRKLLGDQAAKFPVVIDPTWTTFDHGGWTKVFSGKPNSTHWWGADDDDSWAKVGDCDWAGCNGVGIARSYWMFETGFLNGKRIMSAALNATIVYGPQCNTRNHELWATGGINGSTTWNNMPGGWHVGTAAAGAHYTGCEGYKSIGFDVNGALNTSGWSTFFIKAADEGDKYAWRKYDASATKIVVNYNTRPNPPSAMAIDPPLRAPCTWCGGKPYVGDETIRLKGKLTDPDSDQLTAVWDVYGGPSTEHRTGPTLGSGNVFSTDIDLRGRDKQQVSWTLWGDDGPDGGDWKNGPGPFIVDRVGVDKAPGVTGELYQEDNRWHGGVGVPGTFTFDAAGVADIDHYEYGWQDPPSTKVDADALGGKATVSIAPTDDGPRDLYVQSVDRAGHRSPTTKFHIYVRAGNGPLAQWSFEGNAKDTAFLGERHGTVSGDATYTPGAVGSALALDGTTGYVTAPNTVHTNTSLTLSAWAKVGAGAGPQAILSQDGTTFAGFNLWYRPDDGGRWVFAMVNPASTDKWADSVWSAKPAQLNTWTQLTAVYDAPAKQLRLYVNGILSATQTKLAAPTDTTGPVRIGRTLWDSNPALDYFGGAIDEVKVYDRILSAVEIRSAVNRDNVQAGHWKLDETTGKNAVNAVPGGSMGVLQGGAKFTPSGAVNGAVQLTDPADYVSTGAPAVRTDQSFSVSAWVRPDQELGSGIPAAAVSQDGAVVSGFFLGYRQNDGAGGKWEFYLPTADAVDRPTDEGVWSSTAAKLNDWTHLTGVFDAPANEIRLYVDGVLAGSSPRTKGFNATGPLLIGRGKWNGNVGHQWKGAVDEVRAYSREVSEEEIRGIVSRDRVTGGQWNLDGNAQDASSRKLHGTLVNGPVFTGGQSSQPDPTDLAVRLNGSTTWVNAPHAVDTDRSFSVAAWARLDKLGGLPAVVSEDGNRASAFKVRARPDGRWGFVMFDADTEDDGTGRDEAIGGAVQIGQWTHLVAVYDAGAKQLQLYVNGVLAGSVAHQHNWNATGGLQIGRAKWAGGPVEYFPGSIDDVSVYSRALFASEIQTMSGRDLTLVHNYALDEPSGRTAADAVGARPATLTGDAKFGPGRVGNAITLDGTGDAVTTPAVDLRTDQAFTVSAWVRLPNKDCGKAVCRIDAVTVDGDHTSKFRLGHVIDDDQNPYGAWTFAMPESDTDTAPVIKAAVATEPSDLNAWVHLAGVYDPATKKIWLYVNGIRVGDGTLTNPWRPTGGVAIGRGKVKGVAAEYWPGGVDDVRLYTGQLDKDRVIALYHSYPAEAGATTMPTADAGRWNLDEGTGTTAADASGRGLNATLKGGATWIGGRNGPSSAYLDGTSGFAETAGPVLDTSKSFSVSAWAFLTTADTTNRTVLGQDGNRLSTFLVNYNGATKNWSAVIPTVDKDNPGTAVTIVDSTEPAAPGNWTHLALTYDATLHQVRLYVNGLLSGVQVGVTVLPSTGPFTMGRARWNGGNASYFPRVVDEVRAYSRAISAGEVRRVHDDVVSADWGFYRFDEGTAKDSTWRKYDATATGGVSYVPSVSGKAVQLDGTTGVITTPNSLPMLDSFTVSGWARLDRDDKVATVASQDGDRTSGFVLQYRPALKRWVFGAPDADEDGASLTYAASLVPPKVGEWTHLTGVYDYAGRQLRLYVDGELVGTTNNAVLWRATGKLVLGRDKTNQKPTGYFAGALDEVRASEGVLADYQIAERGSWGAPQSGQLGRFVNGAGDHYTGRTDQVRDGYHFDATLGRAAAAGPNTRPLYACRSGADGFTSIDAACEGAEKVGDLGLVYTVQPTNLATIPIYRCNTGPDHFESRQAACEGKTSEGLLGYTVAYGTLARYSLDGFDHVSTTAGPPGSYRVEGFQGLLGLTHEAGAQPLFACLDGSDQFVSTDAACDGKTVLAGIGELWTAPPAGRPNQPIYRCRLGAADSFVSLDAKCEGTTVDKQLGYVLTEAPAVTAVFPA